jgi:hypothetical protein
MVFYQSLLGPTPKSLKAIDVDFGGGETLLVIHLQVPVAAKNQAIIAAELVGEHHTATANLLDGKL